MPTFTRHDAPSASEQEIADPAERAPHGSGPRRRSRGLPALIAFSAGVVALVVLATVSGTVVPRLSASTDNWSAVRGGAVRFTFVLRNDGLRPATITALRLDAAGLGHGRADVPFPVHLAPHHDVRITATFTDLRCGIIRPDQFKAGIRVTARGDFPFAKTVTAALIAPFTRPFEGMRTYSGSDPLQIGWPGGITQHACSGA